MSNDSKGNSPLGNITGTIGAICGFIIGWKASNENFATALITGIIVGALACYIGNEAWKILIAAASLLGSITNFYVRQEISKSFTQTTKEEKKDKNRYNILDLAKPKQQSESKSSNSKNKGRNLFFFNHCKYPVRMVIKYRQPSGNWITTGWFNFAAHEDSYLRDDDGELLTDYPYAYFYAEVVEQNICWRGDTEITFDRRSLLFTKTELDRFFGRYQFSVECP